jgi:2-polyprenyl-3-methyl-5-hydroxy-6-metoxy-1,4-benzoquinol methylase
LTHLEHCPCPLCRGNTPDLYLRAPDRFDLAGGEIYQLQRCRQWGMIYLNPRPTETASARFYQNESYLPFASANAPRTMLVRVYDLLRRYNLRWKRKLLSRFCATGSLLDAGCGTGEFMDEMRRVGWKVHGLERDAAASAWAREHLHLPVDTGSLQDLESMHFSFDAVTLWHVLEHLYDPRTALELLHRRLNEQGVLVVAVPNAAALDAKIYRQNWIALDAPRHVNHFTIETLAGCAQLAGFALRWRQQLPLDAFFNTLMSEKLVAEIKRAGEWEWPFRLLRAGVVACLSLLGGSPNPFSTHFRGATIVAVFQKKE